jgi:hypothetical protein
METSLLAFGAFFDEPTMEYDSVSDGTTKTTRTTVVANPSHSQEIDDKESRG